MPQQHGKSGQANSPRHPGLQIKRCRWSDGRQCIEPRIKPAGKDDRPHTFQHIYQNHHQRRPFPQGSQYVRCPNGFGAMLSDINALEQFPRQIACGRRTEEISDRQSNHTCYPENHGIHLDALISEPRCTPHDGGLRFASPPDSLRDYSIANALETIATGLLSVAESSVTRPKLMVRPRRTTRASASTSEAETARMKCVVWSTVVMAR